MAIVAMVRLTEKRFADYFRNRPESGMGYWVVSAHLNGGRVVPQVVVTGGTITRVRHHKDVPFAEKDISWLEVTHDNWDWRSEA